MRWSMSERTVCDFQRGTGWRARKSKNRGSTSTARRLERDKVMQVRVMYWSHSIQLFYEWTNEKVTRCIGQSSSHSSFTPSWLVLLLKLVKTQHPQTSVHGILFSRQLQFPLHPRLRLHLIRCSIASGADGFKQRTGDKWLEPASNVQPNAVSVAGVDIFINFSPNHGYVMCVTNM